MLIERHARYRYWRRWPWAVNRRRAAANL